MLRIFFIGFVSFGFYSYFLGSLDSRRQALEKGLFSNKLVWRKRDETVSTHLEIVERLL